MLAYFPTLCTAQLQNLYSLVVKDIFPLHAEVCADVTCCRTCCTGGAGLWWTTRTLTRLWIKLGPRTETSCRQRPANSSAATSSRRSQSPPSKVGSRSLLILVICVFCPCYCCPVYAAYPTLPVQYGIGAIVLCQIRTGRCHFPASVPPRLLYGTGSFRCWG